MLRQTFALLPLLFVEPATGFSVGAQSSQRQLGIMRSALVDEPSTDLDVGIALVDDISPSECTTASTCPGMRDQSSYWTTFRRRLTTKEDFLGLHKVSSISLTLSAVAIAAVGLPSGFQELPIQTLSPLTGIMTLAALFQVLTSFPMGLSHRRTEPVTRASFMCMATTCMSLVFAAGFVSPFCPDWLANPVFAQAAFLSTSVAGVAFGLEAIDLGAYLSETDRHDERLKPGEKNDVVWLQNVILGYLPIPLALLLNMITVVFALQMEDRDSMICFLQEHSNGDPAGLRATLYYSQMYAATAMSFAPLVITLRDKRLMNSSTLMIWNAFLGITSFGVQKPALQGLFDYIMAHPFQP